MSSGHSTETRGVEGQGYSPFREAFKVKTVDFPSGRRQTTLRIVNVLDPSVGRRAGVDMRSPFRKAKETDSESVERRARECVERAVRRARQQVNYGVLSLQADHLLTVTYRDNMTDIEQAKRDWDAFRRYIDVVDPQWAYIVTIEFQERGAIHFHAAVKGRQDVSMLRKAWLQVVGDRGGNIDVKGPKRRWGGTASKWKAGALAGYLSKYLAKSFELLPMGMKRYWKSRSIAKPVVTVIWLQCRTAHAAFETAYQIGTGGHCLGVRQWLSPLGELYWIDSERPPKLPF